MKQSIVEVIAYLLEISSSPAVDVDSSFADQIVIQQRLEDAGFGKDIVSQTFEWLTELIEQQSWYATTTLDADAVSQRTIRIFNPDESIRIGLEARNFILSLEYLGVLDTNMREIVVSQLMFLNQRTVELIDVKWVVLLVLMSKANKNIQDLHGYLLATMAPEV
ncbi:MAG: DUF494 domain-containing protein [Gammaproteobacteria bacterium]|nr:DUF494 domain-containing protein [Gammaproteobacteria bacterium]